MGKTGTIRVTMNPGEKLPRGETDWARVNAMTEEEVLAAALSDPEAQPLDAESLAKMRRVSVTPPPRPGPVSTLVSRRPKGP